jgi:drug/metabolite transporter (DMT)-like permease
MPSDYSTKRAYIELHLAVILWGFTAILGKWISLPALDLVWWRVGITSVSLLAFIKWGRKVWQLPRRLLLTYAGIGLFVGLHWVTFYGSIKLSNASICLVCMSTTSFFAALVEPLFTRKAVDWLQLGASLLIVPAMLLIASGLDADMLVGAGVGLLSALLAAVFSVLNKQYVEEADPYTITFVELFSAFIFLTIVMGIADFGRATSYMMPQTTSDWVALLILALLCTTLTFVLSLRALTRISAFASTLVVNLEPVYGILLAAVLLHEYEQLSMSFYIGALIIVLVVLLYPYLQRRYTVSH